jgi:hypothetical protein
MAEPLISDPKKLPMPQKFSGMAKPKPAMMGPVEIIRQSAGKEMPPGSDVEKVIQQVAALVKKKAIQLLQIGQTVLLLKPLPDGAVEFHTFTVEPPQELVQRYKAGSNSLKQMGFKKAISYADSPAFAKIAQGTGLPVKTSQVTRMVNGQMKPFYKFELDL